MIGLGLGLGIAVRWSSVAQESDSQMMLFDTLGPRARAALNDMPRIPDIKTFTGRFAADFNAKYNGGRFGRRKLDWQDPAIDAEFAEFIDKVIVERVGEPIEWYRLKPKRLLRPYRSPPIRSSGGASTS